MQTSTHGLTIGETEVRKEFVADHDALAEREWACLTLLAEHAPGLAPRPLRREDGATPVIVMERLPGAHLEPRPLTTEQVQAVGAALRRLYDVPAEAVRAAGIGERRYPAATLAQELVAWLSDDHDLGECRDPGLVAEALEVARAWVADPPLPEPRSRALGIADHVEHLGSRLPGVYDARALAAAVGLDAEGQARMDAYRPLFGAFWLAMLLPGNGAWRRNPPGTTEAHAEHFMALVEGARTGHASTGAATHRG